MSKVSICLITPSFGAGGAERVLSSLANYFIKKNNVEVHLIILVGGKQFYELDERIKIHNPDFDYKDYNRINFSIKIFQFLRKKIKRINPNTTLSFGGKYNSFVLLSSIGLNKKVFISDRSRPSISYGFLLDIVNRICYKRATGIIAQTNTAKEVMRRRTNHKNISVIPNPIRFVELNPDIKKENIILNTGRFISSKHQEWLIEYFLDLNLIGWKLIFLGDGPLYEKIKNSTKIKSHSDKIIFKGNVKNIDDYYSKAKIFAFTSTSEGFPNALGEAMSAGLACISFNCEAGPSDMIDDKVNGFLISNEDHIAYKGCLQKLCDDPEKRQSVGAKAKTKMEAFDLNSIAEKYFDFIFSQTI